MAKRVIQVSMDEGLLESLNALSKRCGQSRSEVIREACARYLKQAEHDKLDEIYEEGYRRIPESPALGEAQVAMLAQVLSEEPW
ncbi:MAG: ribbon-helix-helix domain-containing protein [Chloroflexi bacterium]|nr:ribbon-helix-helix domain-containing protein [Chloroflexota bacterium]